MAILADRSAATTKSLPPPLPLLRLATPSRTVTATSSGSAPLAVVSSILPYNFPSPVIALLLNSVRMYPGDMTCTDMFELANSALKASQYPWTANLEAAYEVRDGIPSRPCTLDIHIMHPPLLPSPPSIIGGTTIFANLAPLKKFTCISCSSTSMVVSTKSDRLDMPPLLISISTTPELRSEHNSSAVLPRLSTDDVSVKSHGTTCTFRSLPGAYREAMSRHSSATYSSFSASRADRMRVDTEHLASWWARHRPRPPDAPVNNMFLLWKSFLAFVDG
mmetsp:Transcript_2719/g.7981  ORF Transcript_2719/g.7981 Transcript_2719/m.7981 type:complete len:277 (-) Transcript_2719:255-1085(-)